ncbi:GNAT family N-acetyltransferase [Cytobacillus sp. OWB-43]|uniref:GNAT family N-acetyltransferase n=1 Tax=unclassified Cytobacillus TaxID=2675268 RepID=UPI002AFEA0A8|nr:GNAT family N-acetyltransferase [Cytobacillus sp. OWB-43]MEA1852586.1 GNAT family N-acetyltransferase [Cytobacillus sp. OWB-43]
MIKTIDITNFESAQEVFSIQIAAYKIEAAIIGSYDLPPLKETIETLQNCGESFFGYYSEERLYGVISINIDRHVIEVCRLVVHPNFFKKGVAQALLNFIENENKSKKLKVSTATKNTPAVNFYKKNCFQLVGEKIVSEHITLAFFEKNEKKLDR